MVKTLRRRASNNRSRQQVRTPADAVKQVVNPGLPPGIESEDTIEPGQQLPHKPVEKRSP